MFIITDILKADRESFDQDEVRVLTTCKTLSDVIDWKNNRKFKGYFKVIQVIGERAVTIELPKDC